jgi:alpha/beta superfamily hydrolase
MSGAKGNAMQVPSILQGDSLKRLLQGAAAGAVATMIIGFNWGGWTLGSTAEKQVKDAEQASIVRVLAPICADKFQHSTDVSANLEALKKTDSWNRDELIEKAGWATFPGSEPDRKVAQACANLLSQTK